jgi:hypothetical protein
MQFPLMRQIQSRIGSMRDVFHAYGQELRWKHARSEAKMAIFGAETGQIRLKMGQKMPVLRAVPFSMSASKLFILCALHSNVGIEQELQNGRGGSHFSPNAGFCSHLSLSASVRQGRVMSGKWGAGSCLWISCNNQ